MELTNEPRTGFTIGEHIQRSIRFGSGGDVYIRIYTPTQAEFEITLENFMELAAYAVIDKRYINANCVLAWNKSGKISLLPIESPAYAEALKYSEEYFNLNNEIKDFSTLQFGDMITEKKKSVSHNSFCKLYIGKHTFVESDKFTTLPKKSLIYDEKTGKFSVNLPPCVEQERFIDLQEPKLSAPDEPVQFAYGGVETIKLDPKKTYTKISIAEHIFKHYYAAPPQSLEETLANYPKLQDLKIISENYLKNGYSFKHIDFNKNISHVLRDSQGVVFIQEDGSLLYVELCYEHYQHSYYSYALKYENKKFIIGEKLDSGFLNRAMHSLKILAVETNNGLYPIHFLGKTLGIKPISS